jgi:hypothetical protein
MLGTILGMCLAALFCCFMAAWNLSMEWGYLGLAIALCAWIFTMGVVTYQEGVARARAKGLRND